jgi:hypothetical protein
MGSTLRQVWDWFIEHLQIFMQSLMAGIDALIPPAPQIQHTPDYVRPFLEVATRFIALDWLFYYAMILLSVYGFVWGWRIVRYLWETLPFN